MRNWLVATAHSKRLPPASTIAAGPFARVAAPSDAPNHTRSIDAVGKVGGASAASLPSTPARHRIPAAVAIAMVRKAENNMSGVAARANATVAMVGDISSANHAVRRP